MKFVAFQRAVRSCVVDGTSCDGAGVVVVRGAQHPVDYVLSIPVAVAAVDHARLGYWERQRGWFLESDGHAEASSSGCCFSSVVQRKW